MVSKHTDGVESCIETLPKQITDLAMILSCTTNTAPNDKFSVTNTHQKSALSAISKKPGQSNVPIVRVFRDRSEQNDSIFQLRSYDWIS